MSDMNVWLEREIARSLTKAKLRPFWSGNGPIYPYLSLTAEDGTTLRIPWVTDSVGHPILPRKGDHIIHEEKCLVVKGIIWDRASEEVLIVCAVLRNA